MSENDFKEESINDMIIRKSKLSHGNLLNMKLKILDEQIDS